VADSRSNDPQGGISDALREAVERTFAATTETRERAQELLDEVSRRGQDARDALTQRGQEAQEASAGVAGRVVEAIEGMRLASREDLRALEQRVETLSKRIAKLESKP
jgi:polyhydroxyalkanoate synthesis regulator phasin